MLNLYAETFMIATRTDRPRRPDTAPGQPTRDEAGRPRRTRQELPHLGLADSRPRHDPL